MEVFKNLIHGMFWDKRDLHSIITKARRLTCATDLYMKSELKVDGFKPPEPSADLKALREASGTSNPETPYSIISTIRQEEKVYLVLPELASLTFTVPADLKRRFEEIRTEFPRPPPLKRPRTSSAGPVVEDVGGAWSNIHKFLEEFTLEKSGTTRICQPPVVVTVLRACRKADGLVAHFAQNATSGRIVIQPLTHFCTTTTGTFLDRCRDEDRAKLTDEAVVWDWNISVNSFFCFAFGSHPETIDAFPKMFEVAKKVNHPGEVKLYGHNLADAQSRGSTQTRTVAS